MNELARIVEALLFLSPDPVPVDVLADACDDFAAPLGAERRDDPGAGGLTRPLE